MGAFQIEAILFQVTEHFIDPFPAGIRFERRKTGEQIGSQKPGRFFARRPVRQEVGAAVMFTGQETTFQPNLLPWLGDQIAQTLPGFLTGKPKQVVGLLPQGILPSPNGYHLLLNLARLKFAVTNQ